MLLNYQVYGEENNSENSGVPIVFLHGMLGELQNWNSQAKRFAASGCQVIVVDLRNHGDSPHIKGMSYRQMADDILVLLAHLKLPSIYLSGHSMGGKVGMYLALNYPEVIKKLVVVDIAPITYSLWHQQIFHALFSLPLSEIASRRDADELLAEHIENAFERAFLLKNLKRVGGGYEWKCDLLEISRNYLKIAGFPVQNGSFDGEILFVKGADSGYITDEAMPKILHYFPSANIKTITNAGHLPHVQQADDFYEQVSEFLTY